MSRLETRFGDQVDFIHVNWDEPEARSVISAYGVPRRSTYIILSPDGSVRWTFVGLLNEDLVAGEIEKALDSANP